MDKEKILHYLDLINEKTTFYNFYARQAEIKNIIAQYAGSKSPFFEAAEKVNINASHSGEYLDNVLLSFRRAVENDFTSKVSLQRKVKIEVVHHYLEQAQEILESDKLHPATAVMLIGASLEEFLRQWVREELPEFDEKPSIDSYAKALKNNDLITKSNFKEITTWAGYRNSAAHGLWNDVDNKDKIELMLRGVDLFLKEYAK